VRHHGDILGNLSNPSINRWGLTLFWYNFWYSDCNPQYQNHQDFFFTKLVTTYINYGLLFKKDFSYHFYWYKKKSPFLDLSKSFFESHTHTYFRFVEYKNKINKETTLVDLRKKKKNLHLTKT
jgi:hypothetical protein